MTDGSPSTSQHLTGQAKWLLKPPSVSVIEAGTQATGCEVVQVEICYLASGTSSRTKKSVLRAGINPFQLGLQQSNT